MNLNDKKEQILLSELDRISDYYGSNMADVISVLDRYLRYYQNTENQKREINVAVENFKNGESGAGIENLLQTIEGYYDTDERCISVIDTDMFDMERLKEILMALTIYQVRKEPEKELAHKKLRMEYGMN